jgi:hypothetical protein
MTSRLRLGLSLAPVFFLAASFAWAQQQQKPPQQPMIPELMPEAAEIKLALSAAPEHLRKDAAVYVLRKNGYAKVRNGSNGFTCIVNRDHPLNQKPTCYDAEGTATIVPKVLRVGELLMQGKPMAEINQEIAEGFRSGQYISPRRPGVAYMLSGDIRDFNPQTGKVESFPPHVMFYAPNLTNQDIGSTGDFAPGMPSIAYQGPQGFMIVVLGNADSAAKPPAPMAHP